MSRKEAETKDIGEYTHNKKRQQPDCSIMFSATYLRHGRMLAQVSLFLTDHTC